MPAWKKAGNIVLSSVKNLKEMMDKDIPNVLVDVRSANDAKKGHIQGATSIPAKEIAAAKDKFPADKSAPIILYADDTAAAIDAFKTVRGWGYPNTTVLEGGLNEWKKIGGLVVSGDVATKIVYVPKPRPGAIAIDEFKGIAETLPATKLILDVRDEDEAMQGMLKGAVNIPGGDLKDRLKELPKDKEIITHCVTGVRAEMAYNILKDAGFKVRFLDANIKIDKDGKYTITKE
ncbi:MAG: rhodanese-like domain-containing protein [Nitrospirota bacterium]